MTARAIAPSGMNRTIAAASFREGAWRDMLMALIGSLVAMPGFARLHDARMRLAS
jgi:hypothetical protein